MNNDSDPYSRSIPSLPATGAGADAVARSLRLGQGLREKVESGWALGTFLIELPCTMTVTAVALAGFDFVVLDMEHSAIDFATLQALIGASHAAGMPCLVRPWGADTGLIGKALDLGANGILAPHVDTPERARAVVAEARFAPLGRRGYSPLSRFDALETPLQTLNQSTYVVVQIEGAAALERAHEIAAVPGLDAIFVGPYDLALSLGVAPGSAPARAAAERVAAAVPAPLALGIYVDDPAHCAGWAARRFALQCVGFDGRMLSGGARMLAARARRSVAGGSDDAR
jgi:2-keto-3-deoxy-L-rhamnonate aldolase RhmA